jgi:hypothetical protein
MPGKHGPRSHYSIEKETTKHMIANISPFRQPATHRYSIRVIQRRLLPGVRASLYLRSDAFAEACWSAVADTYEEGRQAAEVQRALLEAAGEWL